jgi:hypothetical protein
MVNRSDGVLLGANRFARLTTVYVLNGNLRLVIGKTTWFSNRVRWHSSTRGTAHGFGATSDGPVEFLSLVGKRGERAHIRMAPKARQPK